MSEKKKIWVFIEWLSYEFKKTKFASSNWLGDFKGQDQTSPRTREKRWVDSMGKNNGEWWQTPEVTCKGECKQNKHPKKKIQWFARG